MKVILLKDLAKIGRRLEVKELADGFARNFVIARGLGLVADAKNLKWLEAEKRKKELSAEKPLPLEGTVVHLKAKANPEGHLFASIHAGDICRQLEAEHRLKLKPEYLELTEPIKQIGQHQVKVSYDSKTFTFLTVEVLPS